MWEEFLRFGNKNGSDVLNDIETKPLKKYCVVWNIGRIHCCAMGEGTAVVWLRLDMERGRWPLYAEEESESHLLSKCPQSLRCTEES